MSKATHLIHVRVCLMETLVLWLREVLLLFEVGRNVLNLVRARSLNIHYASESHDGRTNKNGLLHLASGLSG